MTKAKQTKLEVDEYSAKFFAVIMGLYGETLASPWSFLQL